MQQYPYADGRQGEAPMSAGPQPYPPQYPDPAQNGYPQGYAAQPVQNGYAQGYASQPVQNGYAQGYAPQPVQNGYAQGYAPQPVPDAYAQSYAAQPAQNAPAQGYAAQQIPDAYAASFAQQQPSPDAPAQPAPREQPPQQEQPAKPKRPKGPRKRLNKVQIAVILLCFIGAGIYIYFAVQPPKSKYGTIQAGTIGAHYSGSALIVRNEVSYEADSVASIQYLAAEGSSVGRGDTICEVYSTGYSTSALTTLQDYRDQIRDYELKLIAAETAYDSKMERLTSDVLVRAEEVRSIVGGARGNLINEESLLSAAISERQSYIVSKYSTDQRLTRLLDDEQAQQQKIDSWTKQFIATGSSLISFYTDGYEYGLNTSTAANFTPAEVRSMINGTKPEGSTSKTKTTIYRTIQDGTWQVLVLMNDTSWNPTVGQTYELQLERYEDRVAQATVLSFTRSGGELMVYLQVDASVEPVLYMRTASCQLGDYVSTYKVSKRALYTQDEMDGIVIVQNGQGLFVPVHVVYTSGDFIYVTPVTAGLLSAGTTVLLF